MNAEVTTTQTKISNGGPRIPPQVAMGTAENPDNRRQILVAKCKTLCAAVRTKMKEASDSSQLHRWKAIWGELGVAGWQLDQARIMPQHIGLLLVNAAHILEFQEAKFEDLCKTPKSEQGTVRTNAAEEYSTERSGGAPQEFVTDTPNRPSSTSSENYIG